jgi:hypothetical protein
VRASKASRAVPAFAGDDLRAVQLGGENCLIATPHELNIQVVNSGRKQIIAGAFHDAADTLRKAAAGAIEVREHGGGGVELIPSPSAAIALTIAKVLDAIGDALELAARR